MAPEFEEGGEPLFGLAADGDGASRWSQWWAQLSRYFRIDFNADKNVKPLLAGQALNQVRLALSLTLEQAQWAALNGEPKVYAQALDEARSVLLANFNHDNEQSQSMLEQLNAVANEPVSVDRGDTEAALVTLQAMHERHPHNVQVLRQLQRLYQQRGDWSAVIRLLPELRKDKVLSAAELAELER
uniref:TPR_REGION domain-containing protein n=1 Tax=Steinernema glaseri TaxID=37863 RepID=A0A1I7Y2X0_9BILA